MKRLIFGVLLLLLAGCGEDQVSSTVVAKTKRIAIISSVGDQLTISGIALISLGNVWDRGRVPQWGIDRHIVEFLTAKLSGGYQVIPLTYSPADFNYNVLAAPMADWSGTPIGQIIRTKTWPRDSNQTAGFVSPGSANVDAYVAVVPSDNYYFKSVGLTLSRHYYLAGDSYEISAPYFVDFIDGRTFKVLAVADGFANGPADASLWSDTVAGLTPAQQQQLAKNGANMFDGPLTTALQQLKLIP
jgi:hypothetical protein